MLKTCLAFSGCSFSFVPVLQSQYDSAYTKGESFSSEFYFSCLFPTITFFTEIPVRFTVYFQCRMCACVNAGGKLDAYNHIGLISQCRRPYKTYGHEPGI